MGIRFYCPNGHKLNVKEFQAGRKGICPFCGVKIQIPTESTRPSSRELRRQKASGGAGADAGEKTVPSGGSSRAEVQPPPAPGFPVPSLPPATLAEAPWPVENAQPLAQPEVAAPPAAAAPPATAAAKDVMPTGFEIFSGGGDAPPAGATPEPAHPLEPLAVLMPLIGAGEAAAVFPDVSEPAAGSPPPAAGPPGPAEPVDPIAEAPEMIWYVRPPTGGQFGPASGVIMRTWIVEGRVSADSLVWREGWRDWQEAGKVFPQLRGNDFMQFLDSNLAAPQHASPGLAPHAVKGQRPADTLTWLLMGVSLVVIVLFSLLLWVLMR
jgi:hypothetical protein